MTKYCNGCNKHFKRKSASGYCGKCFHANVDNVKSDYNKARWEDGTAKKSHWKHRGINLSDEEIERHNETLECDLCDKTLGSDKALDHCHNTGKYRGTLCRDCNTSLGKLGDDLDLVLQRVQSYKDKQKW